MAGAHDTGLGHPKAKDQVVSPQGYVSVPTARGAGLLCIYWVTSESHRKEIFIRFLFSDELFFSGLLREEFQNTPGNW